MVSTFPIGERRVGAGEPCYIIAEAGVNHNGDIKLIRKLVDAAADAGADAVKFQTFRADRLVTRTAPKAAYQVTNTGNDEPQYEMLRALELSDGMHVEAVDACRSRGIAFLSTPFDEASGDYLESIGVPAFKTPSGEITNLPYLSHLARKGRPMIVSTGMSTLAEVETAVRTIEATGSREFALLQCTSNYPAAPRDVNLRAMDTMQRAFSVPVGYSDHTLGTDIALAAVALGAQVLEKHFTLDRGMPGPDHKASIEPDELATMVSSARSIEAALGSGQKRPAPSEADTAAAARKSIVLGESIPAGTLLRRDMLVLKRPGTGLPPSAAMQLVGRRARKDLTEGVLLSWEMVE